MFEFFYLPSEAAVKPLLFRILFTSAPALINKQIIEIEPLLSAF